MSTQSSLDKILMAYIENQAKCKAIQWCFVLYAITGIILSSCSVILFMLLRPCNPSSPCSTNDTCDQKKTARNP